MTTPGEQSSHAASVSRDAAAFQQILNKKEIIFIGSPRDVSMGASLNARPCEMNCGR